MTKTNAAYILYKQNKCPSCLGSIDNLEAGPGTNVECSSCKVKMNIVPELGYVQFLSGTDKGKGYAYQEDKASLIRALNLNRTKPIIFGILIGVVYISLLAFQKPVAAVTFIAAVTSVLLLSVLCSGTRKRICHQNK